jgi:hypothetical protein
MSQTYTYTISTAFPNGTVDPDTLSHQIETSTINSGVLEGITLDTPAADTCYIQFDVALSAPDVTTLDGIVAAHTGIPNPIFEQSDGVQATFRLTGYSDPGVPMFTMCQTNISGEWLYMENAVDNTAVVQFRQGGTGNPIFTMRDAAGTVKIRLGPSADTYLNSDNGLGIGTNTPNPSYGVDISGDVNTDAAYRVADTVVFTVNLDLTNVRTANFAQEYDNGSQGTSYTVDWNNGQKQTVTLTANTTLSFTAPAGVGNFLLRVVQDGTGSRVVTWPGSVLWAGGSAPVLSTGANAVDIVTFYYNGTSYYGVASLNFA